jgi:hypothetical protein
MGHPRFSKEEIARRGEELYEREIRAKVEPESKGKMVLIDIETGDYEVDDSRLEAAQRLLTRHPGAALYGVRAGYRVAALVGGSWEAFER